jgi:hypothetical protein
VPNSLLTLFLANLYQISKKKQRHKCNKKTAQKIFKLNKTSQTQAPLTRNRKKVKNKSKGKEKAKKGYQNSWQKEKK